MDLTSLWNEFASRSPLSRRIADRAREVFPGGETRSITFYSPYPVSIVDSEGPVIHDADGNRYVDVLNNYTALVHGHAYAPVVEAAKAAASEGVVYPAPHEAQIALAEHLISRHPVAEQIRFTNSGTEAALLSMRTAQANTGRHRFLLFEGAYHGSAPMITGEHEYVTRVPFNDLEAVESALDDTYAAVLVEPCLGVGGVIAADPEFLNGLADAAHRVGALMIVDEVQTLRASTGGASQVYGVDADLVLMAKLIGGGYPTGAVGGRKSLLSVLDQASPNAIKHSGTFNGHLVTARAGLVALKHLTAEAIERMNTYTQKLADDIATAGRAAGLPVSVTHFGSMLHVHLQEEPPTTNSQVSKDDAMSSALHIALLLEGVFAAPRGLVALSTVLADDHMQEVTDGYRRAFERVAQLR